MEAVKTPGPTTSDPAAGERGRPRAKFHQLENRPTATTLEALERWRERKRGEGWAFPRPEPKFADGVAKVRLD